jgi:hypothetical protein
VRCWKTRERRNEEENGEGKRRREKWEKGKGETERDREKRAGIRRKEGRRGWEGKEVTHSRITQVLF